MVRHRQKAEGDAEKAQKMADKAIKAARGGKHAATAVHDALRDAGKATEECQRAQGTVSSALGEPKQASSPAEMLHDMAARETKAGNKARPRLVFPLQ